MLTKEQKRIIREQKYIQREEYIRELDKIQDFLADVHCEPYQWAVIKLLKMIICIMLDRK